MSAAAEVSVRLVAETPSAFSLAVTVVQAGASTHHRVTLTRTDFERLATQETPDGFVSRCFEFLLEREPKESILSSFDVSAISQYFPDFESEISK